LAEVEPEEKGRKPEEMDLKAGKMFQRCLAW